MKNILSKVIICLGILVCWSCNTDILFIPEEPAPAVGTGRVTVSVVGTGERTILPQDPIFSKFDFTFAAQNEQKNPDKITITAGEMVSVTVDLIPGEWTFIVTGYTRISGIEGIIDGDYRVGEGRAENIIVNEGHNPVLLISVEMKGEMRSDEKGILNWEITLHSDTQIASMKIQTMEGFIIKTADLRESSYGEIALEAGFYLLTFILDDQQAQTEVLHVYSGITSRVTQFLYNIPSFNSLNTAEEWLKNVPPNTVDTPYNIFLYGLNTWELGIISYEKYVNLDLSACEGDILSSPIISGDKLVSLVLPKGLASIGNRVFYGSNNLTIKELPAGLTSIGQSAFQGCTSLALKELPAGLISIGQSAFQGCTSLTLKELPAGLISIGVNAFSDCINLALTKLPAGITSIPGSAYGGTFSGCTSLALTELPARLAYIGDGAFYGCTNLALTELPARLAFIGRLAFYDCTSLALTKLPEGITTISGGTFAGCINLALTELPVGLTTIGDSVPRLKNGTVWHAGAFSDCISLALTELPASLSYIGEYAFSGCTSLALTGLPAGITTINNGTFSGCTSLALTELPPGLIAIYDDDGYYNGGAFRGCTSLALTELPAGLTYIGINAFYDCTSLALTELPAGITTINGGTFAGCSNLALTELPAGLTTIGDSTAIITVTNEIRYVGAFSDCISLALTELPAGLTYIGDGRDSYTNGVWNYGGVFSGCASLALTELPASLAYIGDGAFYGCTNLALTELPAGLTYIGSYAFHGCTSLELTKIPVGIAAIYPLTFAGCTRLLFIDLPAGLTSLSVSAFDYCSNLALIISHAVTPPYLSSSNYGSLSAGINNDLKVKVPCESVSAYMNDFYWRAYWHRISAYDGPVIDVTFNELSTNGCSTETTSMLTLYFSRDIDSLTGTDITLDAGSTGSVKGVLSKKETGIYQLSITGIMASGIVNVTLADKMNYNISPKSMSVAVSYVSVISVVSSSSIDVSFTGPTEKNITINKDILNDLSQSYEGSIFLSITETFDNYEWYIGKTKVASGNHVVLQADNPAFIIGYNWITVVVYSGTGSNAIPWSGVFLVMVNN